MNRVELLAPAKNVICGIEAILHGADAVYIGAPKYSARSAAGNTIQDIEQLVRFAHQYHARVFVALNTLLTDAELAEAEQLIHQLYQIGVDALIVQDTGIFNLNLPPIALHASTQADNRTVEKVRFWQEVGCEQVVLARELSLEQIKEIAAQTNVRLEAFVHGALCVSYSGQCYASQALCGRSANKGACAQICRLPFDLQDAQGNSFGKKHWLSYQFKTCSFKQLSYNLSGSNSYIHNVFLHNGIASQKSFPAKVFSEWSDFQTERSFKSRDKTFICRELCFCYFISNILYVPYNKKSDGSEQY